MRTGNPRSNADGCGGVVSLSIATVGRRRDQGAIADQIAVHGAVRLGGEGLPLALVGHRPGQLSGAVGAEGRGKRTAAGGGGQGVGGGACRTDGRSSGEPDVTRHRQPRDLRRGVGTLEINVAAGLGVAGIQCTVVGIGSVHKVLQHRAVGGLDVDRLGNVEVDARPHRRRTDRCTRSKSQIRKAERRHDHQNREQRTERPLANVFSHLHFLSFLLAVLLLKACYPFFSYLLDIS